MGNLFKKAVFFTDIHFGRNGDSVQANLDNLDFIDWFIDEGRTWGADAVILLGDYFDNRHKVHVGTLDYAIKGLEKLGSAFEKVYTIVGNHDLLYRNKRDISSMSIAKHIPNVVPIYEPTTFGEGKNGVTFLPWLVGEETKLLKRVNTRYVFAHAELNGGFMMNAKVTMPDHVAAASPDDLAKNDNLEYLFSGHFHFRQGKGKVLYIGNPFPFNFADAWDEDRGMMFLEWGKEPEFKAWPGQPLFRTFKLSELLDRPERLLREKLTARCTLDIDISYEEAQVIKDTFVTEYGLRKIELMHAPRDVSDQEFSEDVVFQSVDQIVVDGLMSIQSSSLVPSTLVQIYKSLDL